MEKLLDAMHLYDEVITFALENDEANLITKMESEMGMTLNEASEIIVHNLVH